MLKIRDITWERMALDEEGLRGGSAFGSEKIIFCLFFRIGKKHGKGCLLDRKKHLAKSRANDVPGWQLHHRCRAKR